jgi:hypothetical protein
MNASKPRLALIGAAGLLAMTLVLPLWSTEMESPQYHGEDEIHVIVYAGHVGGNLREVETLNQYIGVHLPLDAPELRAAPFIIGSLLALAIVGVLLPARFLRVGAIANFAILAVSGLGGAAMLQYRLYQIGHERTRAVLTRIPDFTPPVLGELHLANFHVYTGLMAGGWTFIAAIALAALAIYLARPRPKPTEARARARSLSPVQVAR